MTTTLRISDFSGGLNLRDSPNAIAPNETAGALNWTLDQRGAVQLRKGWSNAASLPGTTLKPAFVFYSAALDQWLCARESGGALKLFTRPADLSGSWTDRGQINASPTAVAAFVDWPGSTPLVVLCSALTGSTNGDTRTWDGTTLTNVDGGQGWALVVWQNRVWRIGYPVSGASGNPTRLAACKVGDPATWAVASGGLTVDIRDKDGQALTGGGIAGGALVVFKARSAYRVNDSASGSYSTIDSSAGCQGPFAVVPLRGRLCTWGADSLYEWDGVGPGVRVGDKVRPLFTVSPGVAGGVPALAGGVLEDRALYAYPSSAGGHNDSLLEFDPQHGWLMQGQLAMPSSPLGISSFARKGPDTYAAVMDADALYKAGAAPGFDAGTSFNYSSYRTPWLQPGGGKLVRIQRAQINGLRSYIAPLAVGSFILRVYFDWDLSTYQEYDISDLDGQGLGNLSGTTIAVKTLILRSLGVPARAFAFEFGTLPASNAVPALISSLALDCVPLER